MINGKGGRLLSILAAVLILVALTVSITLILLRVPEKQKFDDALFSARMALADGNKSQIRTQLLKASRHAVSSNHWQSILKTALEAIPGNPTEDDYKLFTVLAGRSASAIPGGGQFSAYWIWGLLKSGDVEKAKKYVELAGDNWRLLTAEVNLRAAVGGSDEDVQSFIGQLESKSDPEFLSQAATLTQSAELTFDAALLYMLNGNPKKAYSLSETLLNDERLWSDESTISRNSVYTALAIVAFDNGDEDIAIDWLEKGIVDSDRRRTTTWESLQFSGDLYWDRYLLQGRATDLNEAGKKWGKAIQIILSNPLEMKITDSTEGVQKEEQQPIPEDIPADSWRLWTNLAVQQAASGNKRESRKTLTRALILFPYNNEVKAAWARNQSDDEPALARRLIRNSLQSSPVLGITQIDIDPEAVTPRLYEARLWELFNAVIADDTVQEADRRILTTFLLNYMSSRRNFSSVDVAVDRYLKVFPDEKWILSWRLAADATRGLALLNLVPDSSDGISPYDDFRELALGEHSWRALHDSALFAVMASEEIGQVLKRHYQSEYDGIIPEEQTPVLDAALLDIIKSYRSFPQFRDTPLNDRIENLENKREDILKSIYYKNLESSGNRGKKARSNASAVLRLKSESLIKNALDDLSGVNISALDLSDKDRVELLYMQAVLFKYSGRLEDAKEKAREILAIIPEHPGAGELLNEVKP